MKRELVAGVLALTLSGGCGANAYSQYVDRTNGVGGHLATADVADVPVRGFQVDVEQSDGSDTEGELLAADKQGVTVLEPANDISHVDAVNIRSVVITLYNSGAGSTTVWTILGTLTSFSHGLFAVFSIPVWISTGAATTANAAADSKLKVDGAQLGALYQFARFPQGLPPGFVSGFKASQQHKATWLSTQDGGVTSPSY